MRVVCYHMYQVFKPTILNSHSLWLMESQSKSTAKPQSLRQAPVHCDSISKLPVITSRCKSTCDQQNAGDGNPQGSPLGRFAWPCGFSSPAINSLPAEKRAGLNLRSEFIRPLLFSESEIGTVRQFGPLFGLSHYLSFGLSPWHRYES